MYLERVLYLERILVMSNHMGKNIEINFEKVGRTLTILIFELKPSINQLFDFTLIK